MKIVHVLAYYGDYLGGIQQYVRDLAKRQKAEGHEVKIITSNLYGSQKQIDGIPIIRCNSWFSAFRTPFMPSFPFKLLKEKCDVVHAHLPSPGLDLSVAFKKSLNPKTKLILTIHNYAPRTTILKKIFSFINDKILIKPALKKADNITVPSIPFSDSLSYKLPKRIEIHYGIDLKKFSFINKKYDKNQILFVGRLIPEKGLHILVEAMKKVRVEIPDAKLLAICSETYNFKDYEEEMRKEGKEVLEIIKNIPNNQMKKYYANSACFVMPSLDIDSFGIVLLEAMACGCPVIVSDLPGPKSIVKENCGLIVPRGDSNKLAKAIIKLLKENNLKRRTHVREYVKRKFSWEIIYKKVMGVYQK